MPNTMIEKIKTNTQGLACEQLRRITGQRQLTTFGSKCDDMLKVVTAAAITAYETHKPVNLTVRNAVLDWAMKNLSDHVLPAYQPKPDEDQAVDMTQLTVAQLKTSLDDRNIAYPFNANKTKLIALLKTESDIDQSDSEESGSGTSAEDDG